MNIIIELLVKAFAVFVTAYILSAGIILPSFWVATVVAIVLGILNIFVKPLILILTLPINLMTLGLFTFVVNALIIMLVAAIVPGFAVVSFWWAMLFSIVLSLVTVFLHLLF